ncbi:alpha/beta hydrolase [Leucobacter komagatae]|uniref:alpha/beta hydrolase n=1 Tax=Leucobacter komagatae TaxID=55969 RepID=UPI0006964678|nr:alpha/beta hydrolase [Leucobacter komagatae]
MTNDSDTPPAAPLAPGMRRLGKVLRVLTGDGDRELTPEQIEKNQRELPSNWQTNLLIGTSHPDVRSHDRVVSADGYEVPIRIYSPAQPSASPPLIVNYHGGGWTVGGLRTSDWFASRVALHTGAIVVSVGYRLAPRHPFPTGLEDCYAAFEWAVEHAEELGADPARVGVMGESAGGNLATVVAMLARERSGPAIRHQALVYPVVDGAANTNSYRENAEQVILTAAGMTRAFDHYVGEHDRLDWRVSPLRAPSLAGMPSTTLIVAGHDVLRDEGLAYAGALRAAGVGVTVREYPAMPHGFINFPKFARDAAPAVALLAEGLRTHLTAE